MRLSLFLAAALLAGAPAAVGAQDALSESRRLYNSGVYDAAERSARAALEQPALANAARVVLGRIQLERYRQSAAAEHLADARAVLRQADPRTLDPRERLELTLGLAETLFLEDRFAAAAEMFEPIVEASAALGVPAHDRVLDWWATALDRHAQTRPNGERAAIYTRITRKMTGELTRDPSSGPASYWLVAAARGSGDLDGAWSMAMAAWVRAMLTRDRGAALRGDIDRLIVQAIIPERAARMTVKDTAAVVTGLLGEWEAFKTSWAR